ncbi:carbamate kinase [bacterium]|nr:carbamate kinase [bacterium]
MTRESETRTAVVALGGNALSPATTNASIADQFTHTRESLDGIISILRKNYRLAITHGNGPQIGHALRRVELAKDHVPVLPLGVLVAGTQGWMGYMIEQSLINRLKHESIQFPVISIVSQVLVDRNDPSLKNPSKLIGRVYTEEEARAKERDDGWEVREDKGRGGFRRVVGSPVPQQVLNADAVRFLLDQGYVVICAGGGGIPVYREPNGDLEGVDAVIDKDLASSVLASNIGASDYLILTEVSKVALNFRTPEQVDLDHLTLAEARNYMAEGQFPPGSMGPKMESALQFLEKGGERVIITDLTHVVDAMDGKAGTTIVR